MTIPFTPPRNLLEGSLLPFIIKLVIEEALYSWIHFCGRYAIEPLCRTWRSAGKQCGDAVRCKPPGVNTTAKRRTVLYHVTVSRYVHLHLTRLNYQDTGSSKGEGDYENSRGT